MGVFSDYRFSDTNTYTGQTCTGSTTGQLVTFYYPVNGGNYDVRGNKHVDLDRMAELQKLIAKNPNRTDLKMELMKLQKLHKPKIGKRKKKK